MTTTHETATTVIRARIDREIADAAASVLDAMGLTASEAVRLLMVRVAAEKRLLLAPLPPNAETISAIEEARRGKLTHVASLKELRDQLNLDVSGDMT